MKTSKAGEIELVRKAQHEADDRLDIAMLVVMDPEDASAGRVLTREIEARKLWVVGVLLRGTQVMKQRERADGLIGCADVD